jgi:hypothetical protein
VTNAISASVTLKSCSHLGRPKRNPIEAIKTKVYMSEVCFRAGLAFKGCQLEAHFEPDKIVEGKSGLQQRSCKWDRYINGTKSPSPKQIEKIESRYPSKTLAYLRSMPLWDALKAGEQNEAQWVNLYKSLRLSLQRHIFVTSAAIGTEPFQRKKLRKSAIDAILREGDLDALACLIALMRDGKILPPATLYQDL